ncbi:hypothetical protein CIK76_04110 [Glutamicibacter sp. BW80]|uniref:hypothetical protein n=1 Tax=unclassified Glutamicibacter TaxID=2627139 RepID=UPI000BB85D75|nr:hypothetical protein [Glutamicibacter sp. BW80]PCC29946.1 hypothetical protein CIK76_04110 [Glutamicibacter sp. BW80]
MNSDQQTGAKFPAGTLVFGLILVVVALATLSRTLFDWHFDTPLFFIALVALAGVGMIFAGISSARKASGKNTELPSHND